MPARKPRPKRTDVERMRSGRIASYDKARRERLDPPPTPQAVSIDTMLVAWRARDVALCLAWLARAAMHYHELFALPLRADDPADVRLHVA